MLAPSFTGTATALASASERRRIRLPSARQRSATLGGSCTSEPGAAAFTSPCFVFSNKSEQVWRLTSRGGTATAVTDAERGREEVRISLELLPTEASFVPLLLLLRGVALGSPSAAEEG